MNKQGARVLKLMHKDFQFFSLKSKLAGCWFGNVLSEFRQCGRHVLDMFCQCSGLDSYRILIRLTGQLLLSRDLDEIYKNPKSPRPKTVRSSRTIRD